MVALVQSKSMTKPVIKKSKVQDEEENATHTFYFDAIDKNGHNAKFIVMSENWEELFEMIELDKVYIFKSVKVRPLAGFDINRLDIYEYIINDDTIVECVETEIDFALKSTLKFHEIKDIGSIEIGKSISKYLSNILKVILIQIKHNLCIYFRCDCNDSKGRQHCMDNC